MTIAKYLLDHLLEPFIGPGSLRNRAVLPGIVSTPGYPTHTTQFLYREERFGFIAEHQMQFGVRYLCRKLSVSSQGYYQWISRTETARDIENRRVMEKIEEIYIQHKGNYGSPRVCEELKAQGYVINHKRVERLMREAGLVGKAGRIYRRKPLPENPCIQVPNLKREEVKAESAMGGRCHLS